MEKCTKINKFQADSTWFSDMDLDFRGSTAVGNGYYSGAAGSNTYNGRNNATSAAAVNGYNRRVHAT